MYSVYIRTIYSHKCSINTHLQIFQEFSENKTFNWKLFQLCTYTYNCYIRYTYRRREWEWLALA